MEHPYGIILYIQGHGYFKLRGDRDVGDLTMVTILRCPSMTPITQFQWNECVGTVKTLFIHSC